LIANRKLQIAAYSLFARRMEGDMATRVGFVGLGTIGEPMAATLLRAGFELTIPGHRAQAAVERLRQQGAAVVENPREVAKACSVVVTCVPDAPQVEEVCLGAEGVVYGARPGTIVIDCSTIAPPESRRIADALREKEVLMLDAPISGGPPRAATGELAIMVGGEREVFEQAKPVLDALGSTVVYVGPQGMGEVVKLVNQVLIGNLMVAIAEAFTLGVKAGGDAQLIREVVLKSSGANFLLDQWLPNRMLQNNYEPGFHTALMQKDLGAALATAKDLGVPMMLTGIAYQLYELAEAAGNARNDYSSVSTVYQRAAGVTIADGSPWEG
jgi:3-hydroxyisobutyrate dehydrogenase